jgi:hypothetical protein
MTVRTEAGLAIILEGDCPVEDAEPLLQAVLTDPALPLDWRPCKRMHTAVFQVILSARPAVLRPCGDPWAEQWLHPSLGD